MSHFRPSRTQVIGFAVLVLVIQRVVFMVLAHGPRQTLILDSILILANCSAIGGCMRAALRGRGVSRVFWLLFASGFALQLVADGSWAYLRYFQIEVPDSSLFPSLFYRLFVGPMALALFLSEDSRRSRLESFFDGCIVVGLVGLGMFQIQIAELNSHDPKLWRLITMGTAVNVLLLLVASARVIFSTRGVLHGLFARQAIYLGIYTGIALITSIGDAYFQQIDASIDLIWIVIYLSGAVLALTWRPPDLDDVPIKPRMSRRASLLCFNLSLAAMVLGCTILGFLVVDSTRVVGLLAISIVLISYAIRGALMEDNLEKYLSELQESRVQLQHQALYDELTGLPNRRLFAERLSHALSVARREKQNVALLYFDLDGFKPVNDTLGHSIGDLLINRAALRLLSRVRKTDTLARMGGDEFTLLLVNVAGSDRALDVAKDLLKLLAEPFLIEGNTIAITASMGIGMSHQGATDASRLIHEADSAMYAVKRSGGNGARCYSTDLG